jgi:SAM-dependent methyltransferase
MLIDDQHLERSDVVANSTMNRERGLTGVNSYARDLQFDVLGFLRQRLAECGAVHWLDLCCGRGRALIEAGRALAPDGSEPPLTITGVDLVPLFDPVPSDLSSVRLVAASLSAWEPDRQYDLITCVHGLHYVGDKLDLIARAVGWLQDDGILLAHLDPANLRQRLGPLETDRAGGPAILRELRRQGLTYDARKHLLRCDGPKHLKLPFQYLGADTSAGPNYTGQPAVNSVYTLATSH